MIHQTHEEDDVHLFENTLFCCQHKLLSAFFSPPSSALKSRTGSSFDSKSQKDKHLAEELPCCGSSTGGKMVCCKVFYYRGEFSSVCFFVVILAWEKRIGDDCYKRINPFYELQNLPNKSVGKRLN